ncbi:hypothetical protein RRG08_038596 [Elysia crispata]|uniref:GH18 domain-containing protein n=1 Tax=Elysia crispata TaxID=231223 RepID=A0AAE1ATJ8_9GAST|nr:hypothetical protein RRG08_038596 [Elysia crispata]
MLRTRLFVLLVLCFGKFQECLGFHHVCYFNNWSQFGPRDRRLPPSRVPSHLCTHLVFAYANVRNTSIEPTEYNDFNTYARLVRLKRTSLTLRKVLLGLGGYAAGGEDFSRLVRSQEAIQEVARNLVFYLRRHDLDGVHVDWQYPTLRERGGRATDRAGYTALLRTIRQSFIEESRTSGRDPLILSAALEADIDDARLYYQIKDLGRMLDFACLMAYDMHGYWNLSSGAQHHSPLLPEIRSYFRGWLQAGFPPNKLVMAVSASGRSFTLTSAPVGTGLGQPVSGPGQVGERSVEEGLLDYGEICENLDSNSWKREWLPNRSVPVAMGNTSDGWQWVGYDDPESFTQKAAFVKGENLAGVALWTLEHDDFNNECGQGNWPLLRTLWNTLNPQNSIPSSTTNQPSQESEASSTEVSTASTASQPHLSDSSLNTAPPTAVTNSFLAYPRLDNLEPGVKEILRKNPLDKLWTSSPWKKRFEKKSPRDVPSDRRCRLADNSGSSLICPSNRGVPGKAASFYLYCFPGLLAMECYCLPRFFYNRCRQVCDHESNRGACPDV